MAVFSLLLLTAPPSGYGSEAGGPLVKIDGRESLLRSVELFLNREPIKQIQLAFLPDELEEGKRKFGGHLGFSGVKVISGGPRWIDQVAASVEKLSADAAHVIIHDTARPAVPFSDIDALLETAESSPIVSLSSPCRAPLVEVDEGGNGLAIHSPRTYMQLLMPQVFARDKFLEMAATRKEPHASQITLLKGSGLNIRVSAPADAQLVKTMLGMLPKPKIKAALSPFDEAQW